MGLNYSIIQRFPIVGTKNESTFALTPVALTASASGNQKTLDGVTGMSKFDIRYSYTTGAAETNNSLSMVIEESADGTNWFTIANETVSGGTSTLSARTFVNADNTGGATTIRGSLGIDIFYDKLRVSFFETGVVTNFGTIYAEGSIMGE
jgi:hypothetical protein